LLLNHISVRKREKVKSFNSLHSNFVVLAFIFFILQDLVGLNKCVCLVHFIFCLVSFFFKHLLTLIFKKVLLFISFLELFKHLSVPFFVYLIDDLPEKVVVIRSIKMYFFVEAVSSFTIDKSLQKRVRQTISRHYHWLGNLAATGSFGRHEVVRSRKQVRNCSWGVRVHFHVYVLDFRS
jgi:hypothetical protein